MNQLEFPLLSLILWLPALGALVLLLLPRENESLHRQTTLAFATLTFALSCILPFAFEYTPTQMQFVDQLPWIPSWGISYLVGIDGVSLWLVLLTTLLSPIVVLSTWDSVHSQVRYFMVLLLLLETA